MINKLEIYAIVALGLILAAIAAGAYERHVGYQEARNEAAAALLEANQKVDRLNGQLQSVSSSHSAELAQHDRDHADQLASVLANPNLKPVIVRVPGSPVQGNNPTASTDSQSGSGSANGSVPASIDIAPAELVFGAKYQTCRDSLDTYIAFYEDLRQRINVK